MATVGRTKQKIYTAMRKATEDGYTIVTGNTLDKIKRHCCPLGAVFLTLSVKEIGEARNNNSWSTATHIIAGRYLGLADIDIHQFVKGFDRGLVSLDRLPTIWETLGDDIRREEPFK